MAEYRRFDPAYTFLTRYAPAPDCPIVSVSWYQAAAYCSWLSAQEGIEDQQCYETNQKGQVVKLKENYLSLTGYRLPTEAEWEYACRAETSTSRYFGNAEELLGKYAWYFNNSNERSWPIGSKRPNYFGFFDMHGNVWNWCQEAYVNYPRNAGEVALEDKEYNLVIPQTSSRVLRGGSFNSQLSVVRSSRRDNDAPTIRYVSDGFRPSRTLSLAAFTALQPSPEGVRFVVPPLGGSFATPA